MKQRIRWISTMLIVMQLMSMVCISTVNAEDTSDSVSVILGKSLEQNGITVSGQGVAVEREGRYGRLLKRDVSNYLWCDVDDAFAYDLPRYHAFELTIEYFDEGFSNLVVNYDSGYSHFHGYFFGQYEGAYDDYGEAGLLKLTGTEEWKTATYYVEDMRLANRLSGKDLRLGLWGPGTGWVGSEVVLGSVTLTKVKHKEPLAMEPPTSEKYGNIFVTGETLAMELNYFNKSTVKIEDTAEIVVTDDNRNVLWEEEKTFLVNPKEYSKVPFQPQGNFDRYAVYDVNITHKVTREDDPDKTYVQNQHFEFSRSMKVEKQNTRMGVVQQVVEKRRGGVEAVTQTLTQAGGSWLRDSSQWRTNEPEKGVYRFTPEDTLDMLRYEKEGGLNPLAIISGGNVLYSPGGDGSAAATSPEALEAQKKYCTWLASQTKGIVTHFEIWNEWNVAVFNPTGAPVSDYVNILKACYEGLKAGNPECVVIGIDTAEVPLDMIKEMMDLGAYDYMDAYSTHPYDWSGVFRLDYYKNRLEELHELMANYGPLKPHYITEMGFSTYIEGNGLGYTYPEQAYNSVKLHLWAEAFDLADVVTQYSFLDQLDPTESEHNWGWVRSYNHAESPYGAKPSYLAISAYNALAGSYDYTGEHLEHEGEYHAFRFWNEDLNKDVVIFTSEMEERAVTYDFGCNEVALYDISGNKVSDLYSENGQFSLMVTPTIQYIVGNISKFEQVEDKAALVTAEKAELQVIPDDIVTMRFTKTGDSDRFLEIEKMDHIKVEENAGFEGDTAALKLAISPNASGEYHTFVYVKDAEGRICSQIPVGFTVVDPIVCEITTEQVAEGSYDHWQARVAITNVSETKALSGTIMVVSPEEYIESMPAKEIVGLQPRKTREFLFNLPYQIVSPVINLGLEIKLDGGGTYAYEQKVDFGTAAYAVSKPTIDGEIGSGEWQGGWIGSDREEHVKNMSGWGGPEDLSFNGCILWDEENFYMLSVVKDNIYSPDDKGKSTLMYNGDGLQFGLDDRVIVNPIEYGSFVLFDAGEVAGQGPTLLRRAVLYDIPSMVDVEDMEFVIKPYSNYTVYEMRIPWSEVFSNEFIPYENQKLRFSLLVNDNDGSGRRGWIEYNSGIGSGRSILAFGSLVLTK